MAASVEAEMIRLSSKTHTGTIELDSTIIRLRSFENGRTPRGDPTPGLVTDAGVVGGLGCKRARAFNALFDRTLGLWRRSNYRMEIARR